MAYRVAARANAEAEVMIYEDVGAGFFGGVTAAQFAKDLAGLGAVKTIHLRINSMGGDVFDGMAIYRRLVDHPARVVSHVDGAAVSIASVIAMAGDEIRISESGFMMIHDAWGFATGGPDDMRRMADLLETTTSSIADVYTARTRLGVAAVRNMMAEETWMTGAEAVERGFADSVAANMRVAACYDPAKHKFRKPPAALAAPLVTNSESHESARRNVERMRAAVQRNQLRRA